MNLKQLNNVLEQQVDNLTNYQSAILKQQKALININYDDLQVSISEQEVSLKQMNDYDSTIREALTMFIKTYKLDIDEPRIQLILEKLRNAKSDDVKELSLIQNELKGLTNNILKVNNQNRILIDHSRNFIKETIAQLINSKSNGLNRKI